MNRRITSFLWGEDAKWITLAFVAYLLALAVYLASGLSGAALAAMFFFLGMGAFAGVKAGLSSSRMFGGRKNFTGRLLFLLSVSFILLGLNSFVQLPIAYHEISTRTIYLDLADGLTVSGFIIAAYALLSSARATFDRLNRTVITRILITLVVPSVFFISVRASGAAPGSSPLDVVVGLAHLVSNTLCLMGALILVAQLGKWYATPGIALVAYGFVLVAFVPGVELALLFLARIEFVLLIAVFETTIAVIAYFVALGLNKVRPKKLKGVVARSDTIS